MCGLVGILGNEPVNQALYDGLTVVQHRGQDAAGIMTSDGDRVFLRKDNGLVRDVFRTRHMVQLQGTMGVGHVRYPTAGNDSRAEAQPFYVNSPFGIALGHNGNLINAEEMRDELFKQDLRQLNTSSDSEILLNIFAHELREAIGDSSLRAAPQDLFSAVSGVFRRCKGAYAVVAMVVGVGIVAFFINGFLPLNDSTAAWAKVSPFYYYLSSDPLLTGMHWGHAAVLGGLFVILVAAAVVLFQRRDLRQNG